MAEREPVDPSGSLESFTGGKLFDTMFTRGMALVEETAAYLDGPGRDQAKTLPRDASLTYSAWSMELTTRLMQAASWLVMQKAVRDGEMRGEEAYSRKYWIAWLGFFRPRPERVADGRTVAYRVKLAPGTPPPPP